MQSPQSVGEMATKKRREERLVWIDCEMTGLDAQKDTLLEVAVIVTEGDLSVVAEGPNLGRMDGFHSNRANN